MNKGFKNFLIILLCIVVVSIGIGGSFVRSSWKGWSFWTAKGNYHQDVSEQQTTTLGDAEEICVDSKTAKITVIPQDRKDIEANLSGNVNSIFPISKPELKIKNESSKITISLNDDFKMLTGTNNIKLDIYIPKNYNKNIKIKNITGSVNIDEMTLNNMEVDTTTGRIILEDLIMNKLSIVCTTGSVEIDNIKTNETKLHLTTGKGKFHNFSGSLDAKGTTGSFDIGYKNFNNDLNAVVTTGSININLPEKSQFELNAKATTGKISCDLPLNIKENSRTTLKGFVGSSNNKINLTVTTGSININ